MKNKNNGGSKVLFVIFIIIFSGLAIFMFVSNTGYLFGDAKDFKTMLEEEGEPVKGEFVTLDVDLVYDWYAEMEYKINGIIPAGTERYCLVYMEDIDAFISLTVKGKDNYKAIDKLISESSKYMNYETDDLPKAVTFEGKISTLEPDISNIYSQAKSIIISGSGGWVPEFYHVTIDTTENKGSILLIVGILLLIDIFFIAALVAAIKKEKEEKLQAATAQTYAANADGADPVFGNMYNATSSQDTENNTQQ